MVVIPGPNNPVVYKNYNGENGTNTAAAKKQWLTVDKTASEADRDSGSRR